MGDLIKLAGSLGLILSLAACQSMQPAPVSACGLPDYDKAALLSLKANNFEIADSAERQAFVLQLLDCLDDPDPQIRDGVAYEAFVTLLRGEQLDTDTIQQLRVALVEMLAGPADPPGFRKPFAALVLAEVVRVDRLTPIFTVQQRADVVRSATVYMSNITDYRGFDDVEGWRHGVAHTADLLMQLALNPALTTPQQQSIAEAIAGQVAPPGEHFYIYGEYLRLARPIYFIARRGDVSDRYWVDWFASLASPEPYPDWAEVFGSQAGLARLHNTRTFAETIYTFATADEAEQLQPIASGAFALIQALP